MAKKPHSNADCAAGEAETSLTEPADKRKEEKQQRTEPANSGIRKEGGSAEHGEFRGGNAHNKRKTEQRKGS